MKLILTILRPKNILRLAVFLLASAVFTASLWDLATPAQAATGINKTINFQGKLVDNNGLNVANNTYTVVFSLYDDGSLGTNSPCTGHCIWTETDSITTANGDGLFQIQLGLNNPLPGAVDFNTDNLYLGIQVAADAEMTPRIQFTAVPYAFNAQKVAGLTVTNTTGTLTIPNSTTIQFGGAFTTSGSSALTLTTSGTTNATLPTGTITLADLTSTQTLTGKTIGSSGLTFAGSGTDVTTVTNEDFTVSPNGSGDIILTSDPDTAVLIGSSGNTPGVLSVSGGIGNNAALIVNNTNSGDLFVASASGTTKFRLANNGDMFITSALSANGSTGSSSQCLLGGTTAVWGSCGTGLVRLNQGAFSFVNDTADFLFGNAATSSAKFKLSAVGTGPVASVAGTTSFAAMVVNNSGSGDIFAASKSGATKFVIQNNGKINLDTANYASCGSLGTDSLAMITCSTAGSGYGDQLLGVYAITTPAGSNLHIAFNGAVDSAPSSSSGTITFPANTSKMRVEVKGAGGGGGGTGTATAIKNAGGGGEGGYSNKFITSLSSDYYIKVGGGGIGGSTGTNGGPGTQTCFGTNASDACTSATLNATGGQGGTGINAAASAAGGAAGTGAGGDLNTTGQGGFTSSAIVTTSSFSGAGGGIGGGRAVTAAGNGFDGANGGGGSGAGGIASSATARVGGAGGAGYVLIYLYKNSSTGSGGADGWYQYANGVLAPNSLTTDVLIGGIATSSAKFSFLNVASGIPTASVSAGITGGAYLTASGILQTTANQTLTIGGTTTGNILLNQQGNNFVGIGTSNPLAPLDVRTSWQTGPTATISANSSFAAVVFDNAGSGDLFTASKSGATKFVITNAGNVGIGTNLPTAMLDVAGTASVSSSLSFRNGAATIQATGRNTLTLGGTSTGDISFQPGGAQALYLASNGTITLNAQYPNCGMLTTSANVLTCSAAPAAAVNYLRLNQGAFSFVNDTADFLFGNIATNAASFRLSSNGTSSVASVGGKTSFASMVVNNSGAGDLFTASKSGATKFSILSNGNISFAGTSNFLNTITTAATAARTYTLPDATGVLCVSGDACASSGVVGYFQRNAGGLAPTNITDDLFLGGTSTASAKFAFINNSGNGEPTASIAGSITLRNGVGQINRLNGGSINLQTSVGGDSGLSTKFYIGNNGNIGVGVNNVNPQATFDVRGISGTLPAASVSANTSYAATIVDNNGFGDLFTASKSGATKFVINNAGNVQINNLTNNGGVLFTNGSGLITQTAAGAGTQCLFGGTTPTWGSCAAGTNFFQSVNAGTVAAYNTTVDFLFGGTSTQSAKFAFINNAANTPVASISANASNNATSLAGNGVLSTTNRQTLTLGGGSTGDISLAPGGTQALYLASNGTVSLNASTYANCGALGTTSNTVTCNANLDYLRLNAGAFSLVNDTADFLFGNVATNAAEFKLSQLGTGPVASVAGLTSYASMVVNNSGVGDLFTASKSGATKFVINNNGNVGVGTSVATAMFDVAGAASVSGILSFRTGAGAIQTTARNTLTLGGSTTGDISFQPGNTQTLFLASNGTVSLGATSYANCGALGTSSNVVTCSSNLGYLRLNQGAFSLVNDTADFLFGNVATNAAKFKLSTLGTSPVASVAGTTSYASMVVNNSGVGDLFTASKSGATKFVINNNGNVGIGATIATALLDVNGSASISGTLNFRVGAGAIQTTARNTLTLGGSTTGDIVLSPGGNTQLMYLATNGKIGIGTSTPLATLDIRSQSGTLPVASISGRTSFAALAINNSGPGDLITASMGGSTRFTVKNNGSVIIGGDMISASASGSTNVGSPAFVNALGDQGSLVPNSSFEASTSAGLGFADGWVKSATGSGSLSVDTTAGNIAHGSNSIRATLGAGGVAAFYSTCVPLASSGVYSLSMFAKATTAPMIIGYIDGYTSKTNCITNTSPTYSAPVPIGPFTTTFAARGANITASATTVWGRLHIQVSDSAAVTVSIDGVRLTESSTTSGLDYAENYPADPENMPHAGDVVSLQVAGKASQVTKASHYMDASVIGVVSTKPGYLLDDGSMNDSKVPVALAGRIPVNVSTRNGTIHIGDYLTSSDIPGVAVKAVTAGPVIGQAMEEFTEEDPSVIGQIVTFVKNTYYDGIPSNFASGLYIPTEQNDLRLLGTIVHASYKLASASAATIITADHVVAGLSVVSPLVTTKTLQVNTIKSASGGIVNLQLSDGGKFVITNGSSEAKFTFDSAGNAFVTGTLTADTIVAKHIAGLSAIETKLADVADQTASLSAMLAKMTIGPSQMPPTPISAPTEASIAAVLAKYDAELVSIQGLSVEQNAKVTGNLRVQGNSLIEGILNVVDMLTANNLIVNKMADFLGTVIFHNDVYFQGTPLFNSDTAGTATIEKGSDRVEVKFSKEFENVPVVSANIVLGQITKAPNQTDADQENAQQTLETKTLENGTESIVTRTSTKGFVILLKERAQQDTTFSWTALAVSSEKAVMGARTSTPTIPVPTPKPSAIPQLPTIQPTVSSQKAGEGGDNL